MNYIAEINAFEQWIETNYLPISSQLLWYKLMSICNKSGWSEWVTVDNLRLMAIMQMSREATLIKVRDELIKAGLINYQKGKKGHPNKYQLVSFTTLCTYKNEVQSEVQNEVQNEVQSVDIYKHKQNKTNKKNDTDVSSEKSEKRLSYERILESYHAICTALPRVTTCTDARKQKLRILLQEFKNIKKLKDKNRYEQLEHLFRCVQESDFLCGRTEKDWKCTFDWIIKKSNAIKIVEGNYANRREQDADAGRNRENHESNQAEYNSDEVEQAALEQFRRLQMQDMQK